MLNVFFSLILSVSLWATNLDQRRSKLLAIIEEELSEVERLAKQQNERQPDTLLRLSELHLEKARLWREAENEKFLSVEPEKRRDLKKADFFTTSNKFFKLANQSAQRIVEKHPKYQGIGEVYYILAYNMKELGDFEASKKYFLLSEKKLTPDSKLASKSKLALADYHYNDNNFSEAIPLYEKALKDQSDKWWTKDAYNLAWSYYREKNYSKAISLMENVYQKSADPKYIDMRNQIKRDLGIFYVDAGRVNDAITFYEKNGLSYTEQFIKIAQSITTQGRFSQAEALLAEAKKKERNPNLRAEILVGELALFDKFNKLEQHFESSKEVVALHKSQSLPEDIVKKINFQISKKAAELQKQTASDLYKDVPEVRKKKSQLAIAYFDLSQEMNPTKGAETAFFKAETAYSSGDYALALKNYTQAFDATQDKALQEKIIEGMLSSLGQKNLDKKVAEENYIPVYNRYLKFDSKSERAKTIYPKLFNSQMAEGKVEQAEVTLTNFAKTYPKEFEIQEGMLAKVMDHYRSKKDYAKIKEYVRRINAKEFYVSTKYADALRTLMTKIQIDDVQKTLESGDKEKALEGYLKIYQSADGTPNAKANAAYNLAVLYFELGDFNSSYKWSTVAIKEMEVVDVTKYSDSFLGLASGYFLAQNFAQSSDLSLRIVAKLCQQSYSNKDLSFKNSLYVALANKDLDRALEIFNLGKKCLVPDAVISETSLELLKDLAGAKRWTEFDKVLLQVESSVKNSSQLIPVLEVYRRELQRIGDTDLALQIEKKQETYFEKAKKLNQEIPVEAIDLFASKIVSVLREKKKNLDSIQLAFPEEVFNKSVKEKLALLDSMTSDILKIQKMGSGKAIVESYVLGIESYQRFGDELLRFTPENKPQEYLDSFKAAMKEVYVPLLENAKKQRKDVSKLISENKILSIENSKIFVGPQMQKFIFPMRKEVLLMERAGK